MLQVFAIYIDCRKNKDLRCGIQTCDILSIDAMIAKMCAATTQSTPIPISHFKNRESKHEYFAYKMASEKDRKEAQL